MTAPEYDMISMPKSALDAMLEDAAERGAKKALTSVGLGDADAGEHIHGLRELFAVYRMIRNGVLKQIGQAIALLLIGGLAVGFAGYFGNIFKK
jgi:hypothetical protein